MKNRTRQQTRKSKALTVLPKQRQALQQVAPVAQSLVDLGRPALQYLAVREAMAERRAEVAADAAIRQTELRSHVELESQRIQAVGAERKAMIEACRQVLGDPRAEATLKAEALRGMAGMAATPAYGPFEQMPAATWPRGSRPEAGDPIDVEFREVSDDQPAK